MRRAGFVFALLLALAASIVATPAAVTTVSQTFTITKPTAGPMLTLPGGSTYCQIQLYGPAAYAYLSPQQSADTYVWQPVAFQEGISLTQGPGVYYGTLSQLYFRFIVSQVNFPGITGVESCSNAQPQPVYNGMDAVFDALTLTSLTATTVTTTNLIATNITQIGQSGCATYTAGVLTGGGGTCLTGTFPPSPTPGPALPLSVLNGGTGTSAPAPAATATACGAAVALSGSFPSTTTQVPVCATASPGPSLPLSKANGGTGVASPNPTYTGCEVGAGWPSTAFDSTGCAQIKYNNGGVPITVKLVAGTCAANSICKCQTAPGTGEANCDSDNYYNLAPHNGCSATLATSTAAAATLNLVAYVINETGGANPGDHLMWMNPTNAAVSPGDSDAAAYVRCFNA